MKTTLTWLGLTVSLASLMTGLAFVLFLGATWLSEAVIRHYWQGDDDWLWLTLPAGALVGLALGLRYRRRVWIHVAGTVLGLGTASFLIWLSAWAAAQPKGLGAGLGQAIAVWLSLITVGTLGVSLVIAGIATALGMWLRRRRMTRSA